MILEQMHVIYTLKKVEKDSSANKVLSMCMYTSMANRIPFSNRIGICKTKPGRFDMDY